PPLLSPCAGQLGDRPGTTGGAASTEQTAGRVGPGTGTSLTGGGCRVDPAGPARSPRLSAPAIGRQGGRRRGPVGAAGLPAAQPHLGRHAVPGPGLRRPRATPTPRVGGPRPRR